MASVVVREKDEIMRQWLLMVEMVEHEGGSVQERYEKLMRYVRRMKAKSGTYDPTVVEFMACVRRQRELGSQMMRAARNGDLTLELEQMLADTANELNRMVMYARRSRKA